MCLLHRGGASRGFTTLELIVVLIIVGLVAGTIVPRMGAGWKRMEEREFMNDFVRTMASARLMAMNSGSIVAFRIRGGSDRLYGIEDPPEKPIPPNVDIFADDLERDPVTGDHLISFYPDGSPSGSVVDIVFDKDRTFLLTIHPFTGVARWVRAEGSR